MENEHEHNRLKLLSIDRQLLVNVLNWMRNPPDYITLPVTPELPADCRVVSVSANWERRCIDAIVQSSEFPPVPDGEQLERIPGVLTEWLHVPFSAIQGEE